MPIGFPELIVIMIVALLVLGPQKLPEVARSLGRAIAQFRHAMDDIKREVQVTSSDWRQDLLDEEERGKPQQKATGAVCFEQTEDDTSDIKSTNQQDVEPATATVPATPDDETKNSNSEQDNSEQNK